MLRRTTAALGFGLVFVAFLLQGTGQAASLAPGLARSVVHDPATHASGPAGVGPARPLWPEHFPSLLPAYPIPSQGGGTQTMGASLEEPVEVDPSASSGVADDGPIDGWAHLTTQEKQAAIDRILRSPSSGGFGPISNFSLDIPSLPTSPVIEVELPKIRLKGGVSSRADNATPPAVTCWHCQVNSPRGTMPRCTLVDLATFDIDFRLTSSATPCACTTDTA